MKTTHFTHHQAKGLLHNKFVIIMGGSNLRTMYKDLVLILQKNKHLTYSQLKTKGEATFENDTLLEGGRLAQMTNGTEYREVRQYTSDHHLIRFYFITRVYSDHMKKILEELENGLKPDLVIVNSCVWDISRYGRQWERDYLQNLTTFFKSLRSVLPEEVLIVWTMAMPLSEKIIGGFLVPEIAEFGPSLRIDVVEANFWSAVLASKYGLDVLDMHFHFRFSLQHQAKDGVHWNAIAHRRITCLLLAHVAQAWGVELLPSQPLPQPLMQIQTGQNHHSFFGQRTPMNWNCQYSGKEQRPALTVTVNGLRRNHPKPYLLASTISEGNLLYLK
ncbi:PC-esterase domain-containing protein 1A-like [Engraulis encrasicolus]|uniref:PC-esterase domain-containing protein 1A-like n=1 Tax=Engraulis encrasicolus TaxID=184585 RepID=UPI002FD08BB9